MIVFTIPKGFDSPHIAMIQRNAINSWRHNSGQPIVLMGKDPQVGEYARELRCFHYPALRYDNGIPVVSNAFEIMQGYCGGPLMYINADIILLGNLHRVLREVPSEPYLIVGKRWHWNKPRNIWPGEDWLWIVEEAHKDGHADPGVCIDYFLFNSGLFPEIPPFLIGRYAWDPWLLMEANKRGALIVDATEAVTAIHQDHSGMRHSRISPEAQYNRQFLHEDHQDFYSIDHVPWVMDKNYRIERRNGG